MMPAKDDQHDDDQNRPDAPAHGEVAERHRHADHQQRDIGRSRAEYRVGNVAAVELSDWKEIERRCEQPPPCRKCHGVQVERVTVGRRSPDQPRRQLEQEGLAEFDAAEIRRHPDDMRHPDADEQRRNGDHEAGNRTGDADVEQHPLLRDRLADADERPQGAGYRNWNGEKERQRGIDIIIAARQIVTEFVAAEDRQDGRTVPEAVQEQSNREPRQPATGAHEVRQKPEIPVGADERRGRNRQEQQDHVQPDAVLKFAPRLPLDGF
jgi:hypothetical protein